MARVTKSLKKLFTHKFTDNEIMEGLKKMEAHIMQYMLEDLKPAVIKIYHEYHLGGSMEIHDFQMEALMITIDNIREGKYEPTGSIHGYYMTICRNICIRYIRKNPLGSALSDKKNQTDHLTGAEKWMENAITGDIPSAEEKVSLVLKIVKKMDEICIRLFDLRFGLMNADSGTPVMSDPKDYREIAILLKMTQSNARKKYERCRNRFLSEYYTQLQTIQ